MSFVCFVGSVVDDEISLRHLLEATLISKGYRVVTAANGLDAIEYLGQPANPVDAVLLDLNMPGANGVDVFKVIRLGRPTPTALFRLRVPTRFVFSALVQSQDPTS